MREGEERREGEGRGRERKVGKGTIHKLFVTLSQASTIQAAINPSILTQLDLAGLGGQGGGHLSCSLKCSNSATELVSDLVAYLARAWCNYLSPLPPPFPRFVKV